MQTWQTRLPADMTLGSVVVTFAHGRSGIRASFWKTEKHRRLLGAWDVSAGASWTDTHELLTLIAAQLQGA